MLVNILAISDDFEPHRIFRTTDFSGGWVRDKLLGVSGKEDIDIALDNMAGNDFAIALNKWQISKGMESYFNIISHLWFILLTAIISSTISSYSYSYSYHGSCSFRIQIFSHWSYSVKSRKIKTS